MATLLHDRVHETQPMRVLSIYQASTTTILIKGIIISFSTLSSPSLALSSPSPPCFAFFLPNSISISIFAMATVDISGLDKLEVVHALWAMARPAPTFLDRKLATPSFDQATAKAVLESGRPYFDYLCGRALKTDFSGSLLDPRLYDRDHGAGTVQKVVDILRFKGAIEKAPNARPWGKIQLAFGVASGPQRAVVISLTTDGFYDIEIMPFNVVCYLERKLNDVEETAIVSFSFLPGATPVKLRIMRGSEGVTSVADFAPPDDAQAGAIATKISKYMQETKEPLDAIAIVRAIGQKPISDSWTPLDPATSDEDDEDEDEDEDDASLPSQQAP